MPIAKGGRFSRFYRDLVAVIGWTRAGVEMKAFAESRPGVDHWSKRITNTDRYGRAGVTWPLRGIDFSCQAVPAGSAFSIAGKMAFWDDGDAAVLLAVMNSSAFDALMKLFAGKIGGVQYESGLVQRTPFPMISSEHATRLASLATRGWALQRSLDTVVETSHAFLLPALCQAEGQSVQQRSSDWLKRVREVEAECSSVQRDIDLICFELYGLSETDRDEILDGFGGSEPIEDGDDLEADAPSVEGTSLSEKSLASDLVSWAIGVSFGRFDVRLCADGHIDLADVGPFAELPERASGMLTESDGSLHVDPPAGYPMVVSPVLVSDPGHSLDLGVRIWRVFEFVFGDEAERWWSDVGDLLSTRGGDVAEWVRAGFFDVHLKSYSLSRRKAPILWPLGTRSGSYLVWLYAHKVTRDSLFQVLQDVVAPKIVLEDQRLTRLRQESGPAPTASQRRETDKQAAFVDELRELAETIESVAPLWAPDLNDGVVIMLAPLWRLFAHHRAWSKELKAHWAKLAAGDYDWAQLAMHLWPERVIPECAEDRSLAIAHGLEDVFWVQDDSGSEKWHARKVPTTPADQLIAQRHNPAVAAALAGQP